MATAYWRERHRHGDGGLSVVDRNIGGNVMGEHIRDGGEYQRYTITLRGGSVGGDVIAAGLERSRSNAAKRLQPSPAMSKWAISVPSIYIVLLSPAWLSSDVWATCRCCSRARLPGMLTTEVVYFNLAVAVSAAPRGGYDDATLNIGIDIDRVFPVVGGDVIAHDQCEVNLDGAGIVGNLLAQNTSKIEIISGTVALNLEASGNSTTVMTGGTVGGSAIFRGDSKFTYSGGDDCGRRH